MSVATRRGSGADDSGEVNVSLRGCFHDLDFYIPTRRIFEEGHDVPTTCPLQPGCGEMLVQTAANLLNELKP